MYQLESSIELQFKHSLQSEILYNADLSRILNQLKFQSFTPLFSEPPHYTLNKLTILHWCIRNNILQNVPQEFLPLRVLHKMAVFYSLFPASGTQGCAARITDWYFISARIILLRFNRYSNYRYIRRKWWPDSSVSSLRQISASPIDGTKREKRWNVAS